MKKSDFWHAVCAFVVAGYLRLSTDVCDIKSAIGPDRTANYETANEIYTAGKNSFKSDGTQRTFQGVAE